MKTNLISPTAHHLNDYALSLVLLTAPRMLHLNKRSQLFYRGLALNLLGYAAFSDHPFAIRRMITKEEHYKMDMANLAGLTLGIVNKQARKNKKALLFHLGILAFSTFNVLLTDWSPSIVKK